METTDLEVYLLRSNLRLLSAFDRIWVGLTPVALVNQISSRRTHFAVDGAHPTGAVPIAAEHTTWPSSLKPMLRDVDVGIARTLPELDRRREVREVEALDLAAIAAARHTIYLENQYLAARRLGDALAARLEEDDGPEILVVLPRRGNNPLERQAMDSARHRLIHLLWAAGDRHRLGVYWPVTDEGTPIYVHSKVLIVDDRLLRIGSSNLNNRSMGFDSECDVVIEADPDSRRDDDVRRQITSVRDHLVSEHLCVSVADFREGAARWRVVATGHRGTARGWQDFASAHREHCRRRGRPFGGERPDGS